MKYNKIGVFVMSFAKFKTSSSMGEVLEIPNLEL